MWYFTTYQISVSINRANSIQVACGTWPADATIKRVLFIMWTGSYARLTAITINKVSK